jgi:tripartite-type tricarboxylate transporter receptor subunit TctC
MPARALKPMQARMHAALAAAIEQFELRKRLAGLGMHLRLAAPGTFERFLNARIDRWALVIRENTPTPD